MSFFLSNAPSVEIIQKKIKDNFPYLKIECWTKRFVTVDGQLCGSRLPDSATLINLISDRPLEISSNVKPLQVEYLFNLHFDMNIKLYRKTKQGWLDVTLDDTCTIFRHNRFGRDASNAVFDFDLL